MRSSEPLVKWTHTVQRARFSRAHTGTCCDVHELVHTACHVASHRKQAGVHFDIRVKVDESLCCLTDRRWILAILTNFLTNAFKSAHEGAVCCRVSCVDGDKGPLLRLEVSDTGAGVPDELVPYLFQAYAQASKWRFGTGLGLYHVRVLAEALGGAAHHARNQPSGAVFWVDVPFVVVTPPSVPRSTSADKMLTPSSAPAAAAAPAQRLSVLVVDDEEFIRLCTQALLGNEALVGSVDIASNGQEALHRLTDEDAPLVDLALVDLQMPVMDGMELVRHLRAWEATRPERRRTRAIAVSANCDDLGVHNECLQAGFDGAMPKPLVAKALRELMGTWES